MSKKHYIKLASLLKGYLPRLGDKSLHSTFDCLVSDLADLCQEDNRLFDRDRFYKAIYK